MTQCILSESDCAEFRRRFRLQVASLPCQALGEVLKSHSAEGFVQFMRSTCPTVEVVSAEALQRIHQLFIESVVARLAEIPIESERGGTA